ncbi:hypothetical protein [Pseudomonas sp. LB3P25]
MYKIVTFTPKELFDKVWETPVLKLAQEIGISDVALSKACRKAGLSLPSRGHWAKPVPKRPGKPEPPTDEHPISFTVLDRSTLSLIAVPVQPKAARAAIEVPHTLLATHQLVSRWLKCVSAATLHEGYLATTGKHVLDAKISVGLIDRCALIFDTLIKESEVLGFQWKVTNDKTLVEVDGEHLGIKLVERLNKKLIPPPPPPSPPKRNARWEPSFSLQRSPQFEWSSTGELSLQIEARAEYGKRKNWTDSKTRKIEQTLTTILNGFRTIAQSVKALRLSNEEAHRERVAEAEIRLERVKHEETHRRLRHRLVENTKRWEQSQRLRAFIQATCDANVDTSEQALQQTALWAAWATSQANLLDPLHPTTSSVTSLTFELEGWSNGYGLSRAEKDWWSE